MASNDGAEANRLLVEIARCGVMQAWLEGEEPTRCARIVGVPWPKAATPEVRARLWRERHPVPEPWSGVIEQAPILFVSSNPSTGGHLISIDPAARPARKPGAYPVEASTDEEITGYFTHRFRDSIEDGVRHAGTTEVVPFWRDTLAIARELIPDARPGVDYALTEIVRCKSVGDATGEVVAAASTCSKHYIARTIELSPAPVIIAVGRIARNYFWEWSEAKGGAHPVTEPTVIGGVERVVLHVNHPAGRMGLPWLPSKVAPDKLEMLSARACAARP